MNFFPATSHFTLQATRNDDAAHAGGPTPTTVAIGTFTERSCAENRVKRLSTVQAFDGYILVEESLRSLSVKPAVLSTTKYDRHGSVVTAGPRARHAAAPR